MAHLPGSSDPSPPGVKEWVRQRLAAWKLDPGLFVREVLRAEPTHQQQQVLDYIRDNRADDPLLPLRISVRSGHGVGKSTLVSWLLLWFVTLHNKCRSLVTSPAAPQLQAVIWPELHKWRNAMPGVLKASIEITNDQLRQVMAPKEAFAFCRTVSTENLEAIQGLHDVYVLLVVDEASGVEDGVFEALEGSMSGHRAIAILISNPTRTTGHFYETHTNPRMLGLWKRLHWNGEESPLQTEEFRKNWLARCNGYKDDDRYRVRVLGEFPKAGSRTFIEPGLVTASFGRWSGFPIAQFGHAARVLGLDVARSGGDETVVCERQGTYVSRLAPLPPGTDTMTTASMAALRYRAFGADAILVDGCGVGGGVVDRLRQMGGMNVVDVQAGGSATDKGRYLNLRAEMWDKMREWLQEGGALPEDEQLRSELCAIEYHYTTADKLQIESKDDLKRRGYGSPDRADALCLTFAVHIRPPRDRIRDPLANMHLHPSGLMLGARSKDKGQVYDPLKLRTFV